MEDLKRLTVSELISMQGLALEMEDFDQADRIEEEIAKREEALDREIAKREKRKLDLWDEGDLDPAGGYGPSSHE